MRSSNIRRPAARTRRDRLGVEAQALRFLNAHGCRDVPALVASDAALGFSLLEWIDGLPVAAPSDADIRAIVGLMTICDALRTAPEAAALPLGSEACLSLAELTRQIEVRLERLLAVTEFPELNRFLVEEFQPAFNGCRGKAEAGYAAAGLNGRSQIMQRDRTLSPSDFGFHNALRRPDGRLAFVDFEYFGWDDPVKLVADFVLHPGMTVPADLRRDFLLRAMQLFGRETSFAQAFFRLQTPLCLALDLNHPECGASLASGRPRPP